MDDEKALLFIREEIDALDKNMHDDSREEEILKKIEELSLLYPKEDLKSIFVEIMKTSLNAQKNNE